MKKSFVLSQKTEFDAEELASLSEKEREEFDGLVEDYKDYVKSYENAKEELKSAWSWLTKQEQSAVRAYIELSSFKSRHGIVDGPESV